MAFPTTGILDTSFNGTGKATYDFGATEEGRAVAIQPDGKILIAGSTSAATSDIAVARLTSAGEASPETLLSAP